MAKTVKDMMAEAKAGLKELTPARVGPRTGRCFPAFDTGAFHDRFAER